jgi:dihydroorotate dehydrogenase (NAD+) catalytic subunit
MVNKSSVNLQTQLAPRNKKGLLLQNPVILASGIAGYGIPGDSFTYVQIAEFERLGAFVCKGTTPLPRSGNPQPRLLKVSSGLVNAVGLHNAGIHAVIEHYAPIWLPGPHLS